MRLCRARGAFAAGLLLALGACAALDESGRAPLGTVATQMPAEIAGFMLGEVAERPGPVLSLDYATPNRAAVATVLVYGTGGRAVPSDPAAPEIDRELTSAVTELTEAPSGRTGRRLTEQERLTVADPGLRCALMSGAFGRAPVTRHVCIGGAQGRFVKVQVTMGSAGARGAADPIAFAAGALRAVRGT
ncbi:hypothetical protein [Neoroseomonas soli]|uniref:Lipoprotein n=1 Tax=Neoroseomonas soli TaxID=1081025 RepID=A0A9X9WZK0_9PROT|nr:hypothetical protein [Neoroseomonas soli]MBR0672579.1 hypothetical protein [Neoroseomonas soli]